MGNLNNLNVLNSKLMYNDEGVVRMSSVIRAALELSEDWSIRKGIGASIIGLCRFVDDLDISNLSRYRMFDLVDDLRSTLRAEMNSYVYFSYLVEYFRSRHAFKPLNISADSVDGVWYMMWEAVADKLEMDGD